MDIKIVIVLLIPCVLSQTVPCPKNPLRSDYCAPVYAIIGAQKAATSDLNFMLMLHPHVSKIGGPAEYHYFDQDGWTHTKNWQLTESSQFSITNYWSNVKRFTKPGEGMIMGDKAPCYLYIPYVPFVMSEHLPWIKLIVSLRDPVTRTYSSFIQSLEKYSEDYLTLLERNGLLKPEYRVALQRENIHLPVFAEIFSAVVALEMNRIEQAMEEIDPTDPVSWQWNKLFHAIMNDGVSARAHPVLRSMYYYQIINWFEYFSPRSMKILIFEEFIHDVPAAVDSIVEFLGVHSDFKFVDYFANGKHISELQLSRNRAVQTHKAAPMLESTRQQLCDFFLPQIKQLEHVLHRDLSIWYK